MELTSRTTAHERAPPPLMVFHGQLEIGQRNADEGGHDDKDDEHDQQDAGDGVHFPIKVNVPLPQKLVRQLCPLATQEAMTLSIPPGPGESRGSGPATRCMQQHIPSNVGHHVAGPHVLHMGSI